VSTIGRAIAFVAVVLASSPVLADLDAGLAAAKRGDYHQALAQWMPLAKAGNAEAQYDIGWLYAYGHGVPQDYGKALDWYRKSAAQGNLSAISNIGRLYQNGLGVAEDDAAAVQWYRLAADGGNGVAQYNLGSMYLRGDGVPQSDRDAHLWLSLALESDLPDQVRSDAKHDIRVVEAHMSADEIAESRRLVQAWRPQKPTRIPPN
jgi:hypothetical protein